jgi:hypothetical protein
MSLNLDRYNDYPFFLLLYSFSLPSRLSRRGCVRFQMYACALQNQMEQRAVVRFFAHQALKARDILTDLGRCMVGKLSLSRRRGSGGDTLCKAEWVCLTSQVREAFDK